MKDTITSNELLIILFFVIIIILVSFLISRFFKYQIKKSTDLLNTDPTNYYFINVLIYSIGFNFVFYIIHQLRLIATSFIVSTGSFASQQALTNIICGILIVILRPFRINDRLKIGSKFETVENINFRHTLINDF